MLCGASTQLGADRDGLRSTWLPGVLADERRPPGVNAMARPRVFISSTFYDLKQVRSELERFVKEMGYEPVLNERGHIAYGKDEPLEEYWYPLHEPRSSRAAQPAAFCAHDGKRDEVV
jgi:hypothetical protein